MGYLTKKLEEMSLQELWKLFPIVLRESRIEYPDWYETEKHKIIEAVGIENIVRINHIGSTAVKGLLAKPIIDILLEIHETCSKASLKRKLLQNGWRIMSSVNTPVFQLSLNKGYTSNGFSEQVFHLHIRFFGDWGELYFRDYLATHEEVAREYAKLKLVFKEKFEFNRDAYTNAKADFVREYTQKAKEEFENRYAFRSV